SISGVIRPTLRIEPTLVNFGEVTTSDKAANRSVFLHSNDLKLPGNFVVTKAESKAATVVKGRDGKTTTASLTVQTEVKPGTNKGDYEVSLELAKDAKPGDFDGTVKIYTNDKITPVITVPIKGTIKAAEQAPTK
ncbi:MAG TPA: hypothetical protein VEZ11_04500, partial [Thermoanaerobaculia bacterium]|nr:hypothetical protein [Thermoanaerobaculia bacterium]